MGDGESYGEEIAGSRETTGDEGRRRRAQAGLAWARVQETLHRRAARPYPLRAVVETARRLPTGSYLTGIAGSLIVSAWLYAAGRRTASLYLGLTLPLLLAAGLYTKLARGGRQRIAS